MRWLRFLLLGLAAVYPLYWMAQFLLFFVPEALLAFWMGNPVRVIGISYLQATAIVIPHAVFPSQWEALVAALFFAALVVGLRGDRFLTGAFAIVLFGQCALMPFLNIALTPNRATFGSAWGMLVAFGLVVLGLHRILKRTGGVDYFERLALLTLLAVLPQAGLWLAFRVGYPYFHTQYLLMLLVPIYLAAIVAAFLPARLTGNASTFAGVPWAEILASSAVACLLIIAISLSAYRTELNSRTGPSQPPSAVTSGGVFDAKPAASLAENANGMLI